MNSTLKRAFSVIAIAVALLLTGTATAAEASRAPCEAHVTLSAPGQLDIHMSLDLVLCGKRDDPDVSDRVKGYVFYSIGDSESTGGRLVVVGGRYTNYPSDPERIIVVSAKSGPLKGITYELRLSTINGCTISGR